MASGPSPRKRSEPLSSVGGLLREGSGSSANSWRVSRRSISRLRRREASLLVLSKKESSFAIARISFWVLNHASSSLSAGMSVWDRNPSASKADWVGPPKTQLPGRVAVDQPLAQEIVQIGRGVQPEYLPHSSFGDPLFSAVPDDHQEHGLMLL